MSINFINTRRTAALFISKAAVRNEGELKMISENSIQLVKSTSPVLRQRGSEVTTYMYKVLFEKYPSTRILFQHANNQPDKLASAIVAYAENIHQIEYLDAALDHLALSHVKAGVKPLHYPMVADALLTAMENILGQEVFTSAVKKAWREAYHYLANVLIERESMVCDDVS